MIHGRFLALAMRGRIAAVLAGGGGTGHRERRRLKEDLGTWEGEGGSLEACAESILKEPGSEGETS